MPRSPLRKTEACKASVTHPGPWEEFSKARHGLISAQSFTQGCPRPVASLPRSALSPCHPPCVFTVCLFGFSLKHLAPGSRQRVGMSHAGQGSASWERRGGEQQALPPASLTMTSRLFLSFCVSWKKEDDVRIEAFEDDSEAEGSGGELDIRELRAKKQALARKVAEQQRRQDKIQVGWDVQPQPLLRRAG